MVEINQHDLVYSENFTEIMNEFQAAKKTQEITFLTFLKRTGLLFDDSIYDNVHPDVPIEELKASSNPKLSIAFTIICSVLALGFCFPIGIFILLQGLSKVSSKVFIFKDRLELKKMMGRTIIYWSDITGFALANKVQIQKTKNFWGVWKETGRTVTGVILEVHTRTVGKIELDLDKFGYINGAKTAGRIVHHAAYFSNNPRLGNYLNNSISGEIISKVEETIRLNYGIALELSIRALILEEKNYLLWKLTGKVLAHFLPDEATHFLNEALRYNPNDWEAASLMGVCYEKMGLIDNANQFYEMARMLSPTNAFTLTDFLKSPEEKELDKFGETQARKYVPQKRDTDKFIIDSKMSDVDAIAEVKKLIGDKKEVDVHWIRVVSGLDEHLIIDIAETHLNMEITSSGKLKVKK